jgi:hypothetical protein
MVAHYERVFNPENTISGAWLTENRLIRNEFVLVVELLNSKVVILDVILSDGTLAQCSVAKPSCRIFPSDQVHLS